ncbi:MAG: LysR family transcriptional regulator [Oscillospiraceae bacterium]|nr:LysR family transcriptional regulator [Oscillospiraceae bacterium]
MTENQIKCFLSVARLKSFTAAANDMYISQPAVSRAVKALETEFGTELFFELGKEVLLTKEGEMFFSFFSRSVAELEELKKTVSSKSISESSPIIIGCPDTWNPDCILAQLHCVKDKKIELECYNLRELVSRLTRGKLDAILSHDFGLKPPLGIVSETVAETGCGILYARKHFPAFVGLNDFADSDFLCYDEEIQKLIAITVRNASGNKAFLPGTRNVGRQEIAFFKMRMGEGVMFFTDWDGAAFDPSLGYASFPNRLKVKLLTRAGGIRANDILLKA